MLDIAWHIIISVRDDVPLWLVVAVVVVAAAVAVAVPVARSPCCCYDAVCCHNDAQINVIFVWKSRRMPSGQLVVDSYAPPPSPLSTSFPFAICPLLHAPCSMLTAPCCMLHVVWVLAILSCRGCNSSCRHCLWLCVWVCVCVCGWGPGFNISELNAMKSQIFPHNHMKYLRYIQNS